MLTVGDEPFLMLLAMIALYSPLAALSSYMPVVGRFSSGDQIKLALGLFSNVVIFVLLAIWVGEPLLKLLGISTAALAATGGIALLYAGVPMMRGVEEVVAEQAAPPEPDNPDRTQSWRDVLFTPLTFPLTVGGTSFGLLVAFASSAQNLFDGVYFTIAGIAYAAITGITLFIAGHVHRRASAQTRLVMGRVAGILLTAIAVTLLANGGTRLVLDAMNTIRPH